MPFCVACVVHGSFVLVGAVLCVVTWQDIVWYMFPLPLQYFVPCALCVLLDCRE